MKRNPLAFIGVFVGLAFIFFLVTRFAYLPNNFIQRNHIVLGFISVAIAGVIFGLNYHPGKKK
jgi:hypothetical protein